MTILKLFENVCNMESFASLLSFCGNQTVSGYVNVNRNDDNKQLETFCAFINPQLAGKENCNI